MDPGIFICGMHEKEYKESLEAFNEKQKQKNPANIKIDGGNCNLQELCIDLHIHKHSYMFIDVCATDGWKRENAVEEVGGSEQEHWNNIMNNQ